MRETLKALVAKHYQLSEELDGLNPFRESDMALVKPELVEELLKLGERLRDAVGDMLEERSA
jgi:hypothetical protein